MKISVIIPTYNKGKIISKTLEETEKVLNDLGLEHEIIVVDDGSTDNTFEEAKKISNYFPDINVVHYMPNGGKGKALRHGFKYVSGDLVLFLDADLDLHPRQIKTFLEYMKKTNADIVIGSKRHPDSRVIYPSQRRFLSKGYQMFTSFFLKLPVSDTQVGMKLLKREVLDRIFPKILVKKWAFDVELLVNAIHHGYKVVEAPVDLNFQRFGSAVNLKTIPNMFIDTCAIFYRLRILRYYTKPS